MPFSCRKHIVLYTLLAYLCFRWRACLPVCVSLECRLNQNKNNHLCFLSSPSVSDQCAYVDATTLCVLILLCYSPTSVWHVHFVLDGFIFWSQILRYSIQMCGLFTRHVQVSYLLGLFLGVECKLDFHASGWATDSESGRQLWLQIGGIRWRTTTRLFFPSYSNWNTLNPVKLQQQQQEQHISADL